MLFLLAQNLAQLQQPAQLFAINFWLCTFLGLCTAVLIFGFGHTHKISTVFACQISIAVLICGLVHTHTKLAQQPAQFFACTITTPVLTVGFV